MALEILEVVVWSLILAIFLARFLAVAAETHEETLIFMRLI